jgi:hypothetical protein
MRVTLESTSKIVVIDDLPARVWEGETDSGIQVHAYITRMAIDKDEPRAEEFSRELLEQRPPSVAVGAIPLRLIL